MVVSTKQFGTITRLKRIKTAPFIAPIFTPLKRKPVTPFEIETERVKIFTRLKKPIVRVKDVGLPDKPAPTIHRPIESVLIKTPGQKAIERQVEFQKRDNARRLAKLRGFKIPDELTDSAQMEVFIKTELLKLTPPEKAAKKIRETFIPQLLLKGIDFIFSQ